MTTQSSRHTADLPALEPGVTLLDVESDLGVTPVQALLIDQVLGSDDDVYWVDGAGVAQTTRLRELAPHNRVLERIHVARGFTPHQHTSLINRLHTSFTDASAVIATGLDRLYRDDDVSKDRGQSMLVRALASLARAARVHGLPVIITRVREDGFSAPLVNAATRHLYCRKTPFGPRFEATDGDAETLVYHTGTGWIQTTLAYWRDVLAHRARIHETAPAAHAIADSVEVR